MSSPFDINLPVEPGHDVVINKEDGEQLLGSPEERQAAVDKGQVVGEHANGVPVDSTPEEAPAAPARAASGKFAKKEAPVEEKPSSPELVAQQEAEAPEQPVSEPAAE